MKNYSVHAPLWPSVNSQCLGRSAVLVVGPTVMHSLEHFFPSTSNNHPGLVESNCSVTAWLSHFCRQWSLLVTQYWTTELVPRACTVRPHCVLVRLLLYDGFAFITCIYVVHTYRTEVTFCCMQRYLWNDMLFSIRQRTFVCPNSVCVICNNEACF